MKSFITALIILFVVIALITVNAVYVNTTVSRLLHLVDKLPGNNELTVNGFEFYRPRLVDFTSEWDKHEKLIGIAVSYDYIYSVSLSVAGIEEYFDAHSIPDFEASKSALRSGLERLSEVEALSFDNIF